MRPKRGAQQLGRMAVGEEAACFLEMMKFEF